jgi:hypothetical protein
MGHGRARKPSGRRDADPVRAGRPRSPFSSGRGVLRTVTKGHKKVGASWNSGPTDGHSGGRPVMRTVALP